jgi:sec-independent protein translocase protein TatB
MPFDIGFVELCVVVIVALLVLGPERLPVAARTLGRWIGKAQRAFVSVKNEINRELQLDELRQQLKQQQQQMEQLLNQQELSDLQRQIEETRAAFRQEMQQQQSHLKSQTSSSATSDEAKVDVSNVDVSNIETSNTDTTLRNEQALNRQDPPATATGEESDDSLSGCKNPVEFEPLPRQDDASENTIHPQPTDSNAPKSDH